MITIDWINNLDCCGIKEYCSFYDGYFRGKITDRMVLNALCKISPSLPGIVLFSGNEHQAEPEKTWGPQRFAEWLEKKEEKVVKTEPVRNPNSGNTIQGFMWTPSDEFRKKLRTYHINKNKIRKKKKENAGSSSVSN